MALIAVVRLSLAAGATRLAVASVAEGIELRQEGIDAPILVLGYTNPVAAGDVVAWNLTQTIYEPQLLAALQAAAANVQAL